MSARPHFRAFPSPATASAWGAPAPAEARPRASACSSGSTFTFGPGAAKAGSSGVVPEPQVQRYRPQCAPRGGGCVVGEGRGPGITRMLGRPGVQGAGRKRTRGLRSGAGGSRGAGDHVRGEGGGVGAGPVLLASLSLFSTGRWTRAQGWCVRSMRSPGCATSRPAGGSLLLRSSWRLGSCPPRPPDCRVGPSELVGGLWG